LGDITNHIPKLKKAGKPIIACCRSGARSGRATGILKNAGIDAYNGGSWNSVHENINVR
jgi:phage shock protein E